jgi:hypothetical protein
MSQINVELGRQYNATISLKSAQSGVYGAINQNSTYRPPTTLNSANMSYWQGYNHSAVTNCPAYGTFAFTTYNYYDFRESLYTIQNYYHDGSCGYYSA